jgi:hypothetical protein
MPLYLLIPLTILSAALVLLFDSLTEARAGEGRLH